jgi:hypothetical protein
MVTQQQQTQKQGHAGVYCGVHAVVEEPEKIPVSQHRQEDGQQSIWNVRYVCKRMYVSLAFTECSWGNKPIVARAPPREWPVVMMCSTEAPAPGWLRREVTASWIVGNMSRSWL